VIVSRPTVPEGGVREMLGFETITWCPIDRRLIDTSLLDTAERDWLNSYHGNVHELLTPGLSKDAAAWLSKACAPI